MSRKQRAERGTDPVCLANREGLSEAMRDWLPAEFVGKSCCFVCVSDEAYPGVQAFDHFMGGCPRALVMLEGLPISTEHVQAWRDWAMEKGVLELRMAHVDGQMDETSLKRIIEERCPGWSADPPAREPAAITLGQFVRMPTDETAKDDSSLLTMMFGSMGDLLSRLEVTAKRFRRACERAQFTTKAAKQYVGKIDKLLEEESGNSTNEVGPSLGLEKLIDHFPKVLLYGESGVGKTLIASYLQSKTGLVQGRPRRIPIPEYLGKEDMFEYDLFGYASGAYTGGKKDGDHGLLLGHLGGVVFLDEIGEANPMVQAKLLAFLDDYRIRPRGWDGAPFHCPVLIVAATNENMDEMTERKDFRGDLLRRFTDRMTIPPLRERMGDIEFILDCLLQRESLNPGKAVREIGEGALATIKARDYKDGNFRQLEDEFRAACERANSEARDYLTQSDFT